MNAKDIVVSDYKLKYLFYGAGGTGKTKAIRTAPTPIYTFAFDDGLLTNRGWDIEFDTFTDDVAKGKIVKSAMVKAENKLKELEDNCPYATVVLDNLSSLEEFAVNYTAQLNKHTMIEWQDWGGATNIVRDWLFRLLKLPCIKIIIAHEAMVKDEVQGDFRIMPAICGKKLPPKLVNLFDEAYRFTADRSTAGESEYIIRTSAAKRFQAKTRLDELEGSVTWTNKELFKDLLTPAEESANTKEAKDGKK